MEQLSISEGDMQQLTFGQLSLQECQDAVIPPQGSFFQGGKKSHRLVTLVVHILFPKRLVPAATGFRGGSHSYLTFMNGRHSSRWSKDFNSIQFLTQPSDLGTVLIVILQKGKRRHRIIEISQVSVTG